jgi:hypothetical protein
MSLNAALLEDVLAQIRYAPETHDQNHWIGRTCYDSCNTAKCAAGWSLLLSGQYEEVVPENYVRDPYFVHAGGKPLDQQRNPVGVVAGELLGLTAEQANCLFYTCTTREDVEFIGKLLLNGWETQAAEEYFAEKGRSDGPAYRF